MVGGRSHQRFNFLFGQIRDFFAGFGYRCAVQSINIFSPYPRVVFNKRIIHITVNVFEYCIQRHHEFVRRGDFNIEMIDSVLFIC